MKKLLPFVLASVLFYSCSTELVYFNINKPAPVTIGPSIKKVAIINRSIISDSVGMRKKVDEVLSAKGPELDKESGNESIRGLKDALIQNSKFANIVFLDTVHLPNNFPGTFPSPLSWDKIQQICTANNVDALFILEAFHTNSRINLVAVPNTVAGIAATVASATRVETTINTGWRIYDPQNKLILDEYSISQNFTVDGGMNPVDAISALMNHKQVVMDVSYKIGQSYADRILPYQIRVNREYYVTGSADLKMAKRMAFAGDWDGAATLWKKETASPKLRVKGRAYYNMAISSEINGDLDGAIDWAQKAYELSGKRLALQYLNLLRYRKSQDDILKAQTSGQ
jgi:hypothetical protein